MIPKCYCNSPEVIENEAGGSKFFYCRGCKKEVIESKEVATGISYVYKTAYPTANINNKFLPNISKYQQDIDFDTHSWVYGFADATYYCIDCRITVTTFDILKQSAGPHSYCQGAKVSTNSTPTRFTQVTSNTIGSPGITIMKQPRRHRFDPLNKKCIDCGTHSIAVDAGYASFNCKHPTGANTPPSSTI